MHAKLKIVTCCLAKNFFVSAALLWILCESRHLLGIGTRLAASSDGESMHTYSTWTKGEVMAGFSDLEHDRERFRRGFNQVPIVIPIFFGAFGLFVLLCICGCVVACKRRQRGLWGNVNANPPRQAFTIYPTVVPQDVRTPVGASDVPPNYTAVADPYTRAAYHGDGFNQYPTVTGGKTLEAPPPPYTTVAYLK